MNIRNKDFKIDEPVDYTADDIRLLLEAVGSFDKPEMVELHSKLLAIDRMEYVDYRGEDEVRNLRLLLEAVHSFNRPEMVKLHTKLLSIGMLEYDDYKGDKDEIRD